ncbi:nucleoside recognition domain-containing protein [Paenibacillus sp. HJGM_3]|uniref:nucleoside recognition domain-containing protein n=1 Tax=Paenibacillus sp. HJGM_3 TaxID=3379816 RepID=UPI00385D16E5
MPRGLLNPRSRPYTVLLAVLTASFVICILLFPDRAFQSSMKGLTLWWTLVFPTLLPFLILSELLGGIGFLSGAGVLLDPLMRLLFRLPGASGWALALGSVAGGPAGAQATGQLRLDGAVTREQGERLLALSHLSSPYLMTGVIGAGFLHRPEIGVLIAVVHYIAALIAAVLMGLRRSPGSRPPRRGLLGKAALPKRPPRSIWVRFVHEMHDARLKDGRGFGKLLGDAVANSIQALMIIGGCIIMFSVLLHVLQLSLITPHVNGVLFAVLHALGYPSAEAPDWMPGLLEQHLGTFAFSQLNLAASSLEWKAALIGFALGWSGISQHLQVQALVRHTDMRYMPFFVQRLLHGGLAFGLTFALWKPLTSLIPSVAPSFLPYGGGAAAAESRFSPTDMIAAWQSVTSRMEVLLITVVALGLLSAFIGFWGSRSRRRVM